MTGDHISMRELLVLLFVGLLSPAIRVLPGETAALAGEAGWLSALAALPACLALCWALLRLLRDLPEGTGLGEAAELVLGKPVGKAVILLYFVWGLVLLGSNTRLYGQQFLSTGYRNAPLLLFLVVLVGMALWMARGKLSAFARAGEIFYLVLALTLGAVLFFALFRVEPENVFPIWLEDTGGVLWSALPVLSLAGCAVYGAVLAGAVERRREDRPRALKWTATFCLVLTVLQFANLGCFGPGLVERMEQPFFMMVKAIGVQGAFQRVEAVVMALWVLSDLVFIGLMTFACCHLAKLLFHLKKESTAALPVAALTLAGALLFPDGFVLDVFVDTVIPVGNLTLGFALPALLLLVDGLRRKGSGKHIL